jgi:hypothetical protein
MQQPDHAATCPDTQHTIQRAGQPIRKRGMSRRAVRRRAVRRRAVRRRAVRRRAVRRRAVRRCGGVGWYPPCPTRPRGKGGHSENFLVFRKGFLFTGGEETGPCCAWDSILWGQTSLRLNEKG